MTLINWRIHLIYFFLNNSTNLDNHILFFDSLVKINKKRKEKNLKEIPIIFVFNKNTDEVDESWLISFLKDDKYDFHSLYIENIPGFQNKLNSENNNIIKINVKKKNFSDHYY